MGESGFIRGMRNSPKGRLKQQLYDWGNTQESLVRRQKEWQKWEKAQGISAEERKWEQERLEGAMSRIRQEKAKMDRRLEQLSEEEQTYLFLRFQRGYGFEKIGLQMHMSRATLFRLQDRCLEKLLAAEEVETI